MSTRGWVRKLATTISVLALVAAAILAALIVVPGLLGYQRYVIRSGSMAPELPTGSVIFDRVVPVETLKVGDVITFVPPPEFGITSPVTHRIVEIDFLPDRGGVQQRVFRTKGDRNDVVDPWHMVLHRPVQGVLAHHIPYVGYLYLFLSQRWVQIALIGTPAILIAILLGLFMWQTAGQGVREEREKGEKGGGEMNPEGDTKRVDVADRRQHPRRRSTAGASRAGVVLVLGSAVAVVVGGTAWAAFTDLQTTPQTLASATWVTSAPSGEVAVQAPRPGHVSQAPQIQMSLTLVNRGPTIVDLTQVTIRYWFTAEAGIQTMSVACDHFPNGACDGNVLSTIGTVSPALPGASNYYQMGFASGTLAPGQSLQNVQVRVTNAPSYMGAFDLTNDWSYRGLVNANPAQDAPCITAYIGSTLVWGQEPSNSPSGACIA